MLKPKGDSPQVAARILAFTNAKGGVGKTTSTLNVGAELARRGKRVLLVDLDPQSDLSAALGTIVNTGTVGHVLLGVAKLKDCLLPVQEDGVAVDNLFLLPSHIGLASQEPEIYKLEKPELLRTKLAAVASQFDYILLDCPPALGTLTYQAFVAADAYLIPCAAEKLSFNKLPLVTKLGESIRDSGMNSRLKLLGIFFTRYNTKVKRRLNQDVVMATELVYGKSMVLPSIRQDVPLAEAQAQGMTAQNYAPAANGVVDYALLTDSILAKLV